MKTVQFVQVLHFNDDPDKQLSKTRKPEIWKVVGN